MTINADKKEGYKRKSFDNRMWLKWLLTGMGVVAFCWATWVTTSSIAANEAKASVTTMSQKLDTLLNMATEEKLQSVGIKKDLGYLKDTMDRNALDSQKADESTNKRLDKIEEKLDR